MRQHVIDPEICIRCNTCEATCPIGAISHDSRNYVVDASICNACNACIPPCPTGSIDNWRIVPDAVPYTVAEQLTWDSLPAQRSDAELAALAGQGESTGADGAGSAGRASVAVAETHAAQAAELAATAPINTSTQTRLSATVPPWSAAHPYTLLYGPRAATKFVTATVVGNHRVTQAHTGDSLEFGGKDYDTHHIVLDFGHTPFPVLEGQSLGIIPPGVDAHGKPHHARQYSIASARNGERAGYNNCSLTIKRVLEDHDGQPVHGVASNYLCDLKVGDTVHVIGPFGHSFLMPNHPGSRLVMICTGTGSAPMRAMTEHRRRLRAAQGAQYGADYGKLQLFFGARTPAELPYFGPLQNLPQDFIDIHLCFSRVTGEPKRYVQDALREQAREIAQRLQDPHSYFYVCGLKAMEDGVLAALHDIATAAGLDWAQLANTMQKDGRLHLETY